MSAWLDKYTVTVQASAPAVVSLSDTLEQTQKRIAELEEQQNKICDFLEKGIYTLEVFSRRNEKLQADIKALMETEESIKAEVEKQNRTKNSNIVPRVQHLLDTYDTMSPQEKNDLWKEVLHKIEFYAEPKGKDFRFKLYPKI